MITLSNKKWRRIATQDLQCEWVRLANFRKQHHFSYKHNLMSSVVEMFAEYVPQDPLASAVLDRDLARAAAIGLQRRLRPASFLREARSAGRSMTNCQTTASPPTLHVIVNEFADKAAEQITNQGAHKESI